MKKFLVLFLALFLAVAFVMPMTCSFAEQAIDWNAIIESGGAAAVVPADPVQIVQDAQPYDSGGIINWTDIVTKAVVWIIGAIGAALSALLVNVTKKYIYPWLHDVIVPWLKQRGLLDAAQAAVKYAEAELGRHTGDDKWLLAQDMLASKGYNIDSTEVVEALKAAWTDLNIAQITAGIKEATNQEDKEPYVPPDEKIY